MAQGLSRSGTLFKIVTLCTMLLSQNAVSGEVLRLKNGNVRVQQPSSRLSAFSGSLSVAPAAGRFHIVQFTHDFTEVSRKALQRAGFKVHGYVPDDAVIVEATAPGALQNLQTLNGVQGVTPYTPDLKISDELMQLDATEATVHIRIFNESEAAQIAAALKKAGANHVHTTNGRSLYAKVSPKALGAIGAIEGIEWAEQYTPLMMHDFQPEAMEPMQANVNALSGFESGTKVMNFDAAWSKGLTGKGQIVAMADTGVDTGILGKLHSDLSNVVKGMGFANGGRWHDTNGHGTHVAGSVLGTGANSQGKVKGGAHSAQMIAQGLWSDTGGTLAVPPSLSQLFGPAYQGGARVHTNSWGSVRNAYDNFAIQVDEFMWNNPDMLIIFAAGNSGLDTNKDGRIDEGSLGSPATAKNALSVGASENYVTQGGRQVTWGQMKPNTPNSVSKWPIEPLASDKISNNPNGLAAFSSRGPTRDGRIKPDVVAPGTNILSARSSQTKPTDVMWGAFNEKYLYAGGTSMATPLTAGAAAVVREYLVKVRGMVKPSAALIKGILMHTATDLFPGQFGTGPKQELPTARPNNHEGFGRVDVAKATSVESSQLKDEQVGVGTGEAKTFDVKVNGGKKLVVTLTYTDAPGSAAAAKALVNDLDLSIVGPNGKVYEIGDRTNNNELIEIANPALGQYKVSVKGVKVPSGKNGKQPFAVVMGLL